MSKKRALPETLCPVPWINMSLDVNGSFRPCCKFAQPEKSTRDLGNLKTHSLEKIWNSEGIVQLRRDFLAGSRPKECSACWDEEAAGVRSYRQEFLVGRLDEEIDYGTVEPAAPRTLDLKLSNLCNLKCRICGPVASSTWLNEAVENDPDFEPGIQAERKYFQSNKITGSQENLDTFISWLPQLRHVELFGGEPLLSKENREILDLMAAQGSPEKISLLYNTNITLFSQDMVERWKRFKKVTLCLSLDDIEGRLEYERAPAKWAALSKNILSYASIGAPNIRVVVFCSVSSFNIWYLPELIRWVSENAPQLEIVFNLVHTDPEYSVVHVPEPLKKGIVTRLLRNPLSGYHAKLVAIAEFMNSRSSDPNLWRKFLEQADRMDRIRGESFSKVFPEYWKAILDAML